MNKKNQQHVILKQPVCVLAIFVIKGNILRAFEITHC